MLYERVTYKPDGAERARSIFLRDVSESSRLLRGIEVERDGGNAGDLKVAMREHIIDKTLVKARVPYRMDFTYGYLVPA